MTGGPAGRAALALALASTLWASAASAAPKRTSTTNPPAGPSDPEPAATDWPATITRLRQQLDGMPGHADTRQQLATAYNNYGVQLLEQGHLLEAQRQFELAIRTAPQPAEFITNLATLHLNAASAAYQARDTAAARTQLEYALKLTPDRAEAHALLGEVEYQSQRLKEAKAAWTRAIELNPDIRGVADKLAQVNRELPVESTFDRVSQFSFDIRYSDDLKSPTGYDVRDALLRARREVGNDFALWPKYKLVVLVYSAEQFRQLRQETPDWVAGQFDGKIRMPWPGPTMDPKSVTRVLYHEYTHALVHEVCGRGCPTWFNEGLAEYEAWKGDRRPWSQLPRAFAENRLIPWEQLNTWFSYTLSGQDVQLAYEQSHSIVQYLVERYSFWRMRRVMQQLSDVMPIDEALTKELRTKLPRLQRDWQSWLAQQLGTTAPG
jgi:tetratricopeptide (TPR) repeat protein